MHSVSFGCWTPKLRVIVYDNFNQDVYKKKKEKERKREKVGYGKERRERVLKGDKALL
ncbi:hypothetical protein I3A84_19895 [Salmonella enterica]|nr:hypothetical protein [Salmonella enterica]